MFNLIISVFSSFIHNLATLAWYHKVMLQYYLVYQNFKVTNKNLKKMSVNLEITEQFSLANYSRLELTKLGYKKVI